MAISSSVFISKDCYLHIGGVQHREALKDVLDHLLGVAIQVSFLARGVELRLKALLSHPGLIAASQVHKLNVDVDLEQDVAEHD